MVKSETIYCSVACNRTSNSLDWNTDNKICFAAKNSIVICEPGDTHEPWKFLNQTNAHKDRVNTCKWLDGSGFILSGGDDMKIAISDQKSPRPSQILEGHEASVTVIDGQMCDNNEILIASTGTDSKLLIWKGTVGDVKCIESINLGTKFCLALKLFTFDDQIFLAYSTDDCKIILCVHEDDKFVQKLTLVGHEDWVLSLDFIIFEDYLLLASGSQDFYIRMHKIFHTKESIAINPGDLDVEQESRSFKVGPKSFTVSTESVLQSHEGWVTAVHFNKNDGLKLLSASADRTVIIWEPASETGIWTEKIRTGEVGGNTFGFSGAKFSPTGNSVIAHGYYGSFHKWDKCGEIWDSAVVMGGHFGSVVDMHWEPEGKYLLSVSADQTTRLHAPWVVNGSERSWHEIARPQIHGYDMHCVIPLTRYRFASGAEEKIVRVFDAPLNFVENFKSICGVDVNFEGKNHFFPYFNSKIKFLGISRGASRPTLGLSNKAVNENIEVTNLKQNEYPDHYFVETKLQEPPCEETLLQNTLWPETHKLYGHEGYEIFSLASTHQKSIPLIASACKASTIEHAQVLIWNCSTWKVKQKLSSHQLTVTQMEFSPDDRFLLTVSRDRRWSLFEEQNDEFKLLASTDKTNGVHTRIIWCCTWAHDSEIFATGSREGKVVAWKAGEKVSPIAVFDTKRDVTALAFYRKSFDGGYLIAFGFGSGEIELYCLKNGEFTKIHEIFGHQLTVKRLEFRPNTESIELASCSDDHFVKIHQIQV